jgi:membrane carboxypeptidase/penicillin-binding protein PbpC
MKGFARLVAIVALWFVRREWLELRERLARAYKSHKDDYTGCPSILARQLLISGEDHRFFGHSGIDLIAVCRSVWRGVVFRRPEGASTIEMQVVRVVSGKYERTLARKVREMALATLVTRAIPKEALPAIYLRLGYFGWRMNGFSAACRCIGRCPASLAQIDTARLVARLKYPQPCEISPHRRAQIDMRARHLLRLHASHRLDHTFLGLVRKPAYATI